MANTSESMEFSPPELLRSYEIEQPLISVGEHYKIRALGVPEVYAFRPSGILRALLAMFAGVFAFLVLGALIAMLSTAVDLPGPIAFGVLAIATFLTMLRLWPRRNITFYADEQRKQMLWMIKEDWPFLPDFMRKFTVIVPELPKVIVSNWAETLRVGPAWQLAQDDGKVLFRAELNSRSILPSTAAGRGFKILDFIFVLPNSNGNGLLAEFNRELTLNDKYQLRVYRTSTEVDARWILAMAILLDTGLKR